MASLVLAQTALRRSPRHLFDVDRVLFDYRRVSDVGRESVGEFGSDVSLSFSLPRSASFTICDELHGWMLEF